MALRRYKTAADHFLEALAGFENVGPASLESELITRAYLVQAYESLDMSDAATEHCLAIGAKNMMSPDQDYQPLFRVAPEYPVQLLSRLEEGYVNLAFTVDANGFVQDPVPIDRQGNSAFERAAIKAVERFQYAPQFENGEPVAVNDVRTRFNFKISD